MLIIIDTDDWLHYVTGPEIAEKWFELQDVIAKEYQACDEDGRLYRFVVEGVNFRLLSTDVLDVDLPIQFIRRFAKCQGFTGPEIDRIFAEEKGYPAVIARIETKVKRQRYMKS